MNCWEYMRCGRQPGGNKVSDFGVCPAAEENLVDGINGGNNGGRCCWAVAGTYCGGKVKGTAAMKNMNCMKCEFYRDVWREENNKGTYTPPVEIFRKLSR